MPTHWLQYWRPQQLERERLNGVDGEPFVDTAGEQFAAVRPGDVVYVLARSGASLLLIGRLTVNAVFDHDAAEAHFPDDDVYEATVHLIGHGSTRRLNRVIPKDIAMRLRRASGKPLVDAEGNADGGKLQRVGPLDAASVTLLDDQLDRDDMLVPLRGFPEGEPTQRRHRGVERNPALRAAALRVHGHGCMVCGFDFGRAYGARGMDFAEVHHLKAFASLRGKTVLTNPVTDVAVLCSNCHRMVHRGEDAPISIDQLRAELRRD